MSLKTQFNNVKENWLLALVVLVLLAVPLFSGSMGSAVKSYGYPDIAMVESMVAPSGLRDGVYYDEDFAPGETDRKVTKNAYLTSEVERGEFFDSETKLKAIVSASSSILINENVNKQDRGWKTTYSGYYQIEVKATKYDAVIGQLKNLGEIESFSENSRDITGNYVSLTEELKLEKDRLARYKEMYNEVTDVSDKIQLSDKIFNQERRVKYLEDRLVNQDLQVEYSTVTVTLREKSSEYTNIVLIKFSQMVRKLVNSFNSLIALVFWILPWAIAVLVGWLVYRKVKK